MDSKFLKNTLLVSLLFMITIFFVVLYSSGMGPGQKAKEASQEDAVREIILEGQIGSDPYGWMEDEDFFDEGAQVEETAEGMVQVSMLASSVEKDMRVTILDQDGKPVKGQFFEILLNGQDEYKDLDRDGIIYVADLNPGEYQVTMKEMAGFVIPTAPMPVTVKAKVEYVPIPDIYAMIKTEQEVDSMAEDGGRTKEEEGPNDPTELKTSAGGSLGIDVSRWNENIDWEKVKEAGVNYAIIRAGYRGSVTGALVEDWYFKSNIEGAANAGIPIGIYFFTQAVNEVEAVEEASMVLALCENYNIEYPIFIDTEGAGGNGRADKLDADTRTAVCQAFCHTITNAGYKAGIYASKNWFNNNIRTSILPDNTYIWLAEYGDYVTYTGRYNMWQYTSSGRVNGIEGRVDLNISYSQPVVRTETDIKRDQNANNTNNSSP